MIVKKILNITNYVLKFSEMRIRKFFKSIYVETNLAIVAITLDLIFLAADKENHIQIMLNLHSINNIMIC